MLKIDKNELRKLLLEDRKKYIESPRLYGISEIISGISLGITIFLGDYSKLTFVNQYIFQFVVWIICIVLLLCGIYLLVHSLRNRYTAENLFSEICEIDHSVEHAFNLVLINEETAKKDGKYLLYKNYRWKCFHFLSYKVKRTPYDTDYEKREIVNSIQNDVGIIESEILEIQFIGDLIDKKFSEGDKIYKKFHFYLYGVITNHKFKKTIFKKTSSFRYNGKKYKWYSIDQMYKNNRMKKTNKKVLDYVRNQRTLS